MGFSGSQFGLPRTLRSGRAALVASCLFLLASLTLSGCGTANFPEADFRGLDELASLQVAMPAPHSSALPILEPGATRPLYTIGPLDQITVVVWGRPDLGSQVPSPDNSRRNVTTVDAGGEISLPFLPRVQVSGLRLWEANLSIAHAYSEIVPDPEVETEMNEFRSRPVQIEGEVAQPGTVYLSDTVLTLGEALKAAGGPTREANSRNVTLTRDGRPHSLDVWAAYNGLSTDLDIILEPGDRVFFPPARDAVFYVLGDVENQGAFPLPATGVTLLQALGSAGGLNLDTASDHNLLLMRTEGDETVAYEFKFFEAMAHEDIALATGDRIYVSRSRLSNFGDGWRNVVPFLSTITAAYFIDRIMDTP